MVLETGVLYHWYVRTYVRTRVLQITTTISINNECGIEHNKHSTGKHMRVASIRATTGTVPSRQRVLWSGPPSPSSPACEPAPASPSLGRSRWSYALRVGSTVEFILTGHRFAWPGSRHIVEPLTGRFVDASTRLQDEGMRLSWSAYFAALTAA